MVETAGVVVDAELHARRRSRQNGCRPRSTTTSPLFPEPPGSRRTSTKRVVLRPYGIHGRLTWGGSRLRPRASRSGVMLDTPVNGQWRWPVDDHRSSRDACVRVVLASRAMTDATSRLVDPPPPGQHPSPASTRLTSLDALPGDAMVFMASEIMHIPSSVARHFPESGVARVLADLLDHRAQARAPRRTPPASSPKIIVASDGTKFSVR